MKKLIVSSIAILTTLGLTACKMEETTYLRVTHASSDAPLVNVELDNDVVDGLEMVDYRQSSGLLDLTSDTYHIAVNALLPGDVQAEVINATKHLTGDTIYDVIALNYASVIEPVILSRPYEEIPEGSVRLDVLHGHPDVPGVDVYLAPGDTIDSLSPAISGLTFKYDDMDLPVTIPAGDYRIRITLAGEKEVVFDSGDLPLPGGSDFMITAVPNVDSAATSPVNLLVADDAGSFILRDNSTLANVRVAHAVSDAPAVDVLASGVAVDDLSEIEFQSSASLDLAPDPFSYNLSVAASIDNSLVIIGPVSLSFPIGETTSIYAIGDLNSIVDETIEPLPINEDLRSVALYAKLRVIHASTIAQGIGPVDIHASADGTFDGSTAVLTGVELNGTAVLNVPGGEYSFAVILAGDDTFTPVIETSAILTNGGVYTAIATNDFSDLWLINDTPE